MYDLSSELYGPKVLKEVTANIEISGPVSFTKTFGLKLTIPKNTCPTVDKSGQVFKIEYTLRVSVNLNEENPYRQEIPQDVVLFNVPFTIGTCPKLSFNIDDDDESDDEYMPPISDNASNHSSELNEVTKTMQDMDLSQVIAAQDGITPLPPLSPSSKPTYVAPLIKSPPKPISVNHSLYKPNTPSPVAVRKHDNVEEVNVEEANVEEDLATKSLPLIPESPIYNSDEGITVTPPPEENNTAVTPPSPLKSKISPSDIFNDYNPGLSPTSPVQGHESLNNMPVNAAEPGLGRNKSFHLIVRNQETPAPVSPEVSQQYGSSLPTNTGFTPRPYNTTNRPPQPSPSTSNHTHGGFAAAQLPYGFSPQPTPMMNHGFPPTMNHGFPPQPTPSISSGYNGYPPRPRPNYMYPQQGGYPYTQPGFSGMPEPQMNYSFGGPVHSMPMPQFNNMPTHQSNYPPSSYSYHPN